MRSLKKVDSGASVAFRNAVIVRRVASQIKRHTMCQGTAEFTHSRRKFSGSIRHGPYVRSVRRDLSRKFPRSTPMTSIAKRRMSESTVNGKIQTMHAEMESGPPRQSWAGLTPERSGLQLETRPSKSPLQDVSREAALVVQHREVL